jgi:hypothetical protein
MPGGATITQAPVAVAFLASFSNSISAMTGPSEMSSHQPSLFA